MKSEGLGKILGIAFVLAVVLYAASFAWIQHKRDSKGPWTVIFLSDNSGSPYVLISQPALKIDNCKISFPGQKASRPNLVRPVYFDGPTTNIPFGEVVFQDPTFLPGTITFNFWGHGIELMPRTLVIDKKEVPWNSNTNITVRGAGKLERRQVK
jgi:hypothetical protein